MQAVKLSALAALVAVGSAQSSASASASSSSSSSNPCSSNLNVTAQTDLDSIASCGSFNGSINIGGSAGVLTLNGVQNVTGDLIVNNATALTSFSAPVLRTVNGDLKFQYVTVMNTLSIPQLTKVGSLEIITAPALEELQFNAGIQEANSVLITDTSLNSLSGLNLSQVESFNVNNNRYINQVLAGITSVTNALDVSFNSEDVNVSFPYLKWANNATFQFCAGVSMPQLQSVNQSFGIINNTMQSISFDNLATVGQTLIVSSNSDLSNVSFANLTKVGGGFDVANNTKLRAVLGFPKLARIGGAVQIIGNFTQASLPSLQEVDGGVVVESSNVFNCSSFDKAHSDGDIHGDKYVCSGKSESKSFSMKPTTVAKSGSGSSSGSASASATGSGSGSSAAASGSDSSSAGASSSKKKNAAPSVGVSTGIVSGFVALLFQML